MTKVSGSLRLETAPPAAASIKTVASPGLQMSK